MKSAAGDCGNEIDLRAATKRVAVEFLAKTKEMTKPENATAPMDALELKKQRKIVKQATAVKEQRETDAAGAMKQ